MAPRNKSRLIRNFENLKVLRSAGPVERKHILLTARGDLIHCLIDCIHNVLNGNIELTHSQREQLKKSRGILRELVRKKVPLYKKRQIFVQKGGFLSALLGPIIGIASSALSGLLSR